MSIGTDVSGYPKESTGDFKLTSDDIDLTPGDDIIMNPGGDIRIFEDLDMDGTNTFDSGVSLSSAPGGSPIGAWVIKIQGVSKLINVYNP